MPDLPGPPGLPEDAAAVSSPSVPLVSLPRPPRARCGLRPVAGRAGAGPRLRPLPSSASARRRRIPRWACARGTTRRYRGQGRPGGAVLPAQWGMRYERAGCPSRSSTRTSRRSAGGARRPRRCCGRDQVNLRGLHPLARAEIQWGMCLACPAPARAVGAGPMLQRLADYGRDRALSSLTDLDPDDPGLRKAAGREAPASPGPSPMRPAAPLPHARRRPGRPATSSPGTSGASSATAPAASTCPGSPSGGCATLSGTTSPTSCGRRPARAPAAPSTTRGAPGWN